MDATRSRRSRDSARQGWYAHWRSVRFARHLGFFPPKPKTPLVLHVEWLFDVSPHGSAMRLCG
jgi:hypothetical protein